MEVRAATAADAAEITRLLGTVEPGLADRLAALRGRADAAVLVATGWNALSGVAVVQWHTSLHQARPVAQLAALVVDPGDRRRGIGRMLLKAVSQAARAGGCDALDLVADADAAQAFGAATGFTAGPPVMRRGLRRRGPSPDG